jgi:epsin
MKVVWERIDDKKVYRHVSKGLQLLEFLIINGSERVPEEAKYNMATITDLKYFHFRDESGKDIGLAG